MYVTNIKGEVNGPIVFLHMVKTAGTSVHDAFLGKGYPISFNQKHLDISCLPDKYRKLPKYTLMRDPESWYRSFYSYYQNTTGFFSFLLRDFDDEGNSALVGINEFIIRCLNLKHTFMRYPKKATMFNNILQQQQTGHFMTTYFENSIDITREESLNQFNMSLYEWFWNHTGMNECIIVPMNKIQDLEKEFDIKLVKSNETPQENIVNDVIVEDVLIKLVNSHIKFYDLISIYNSIDEQVDGKLLVDKYETLLKEVIERDSDQKDQKDQNEL